MSIFAKDYHVTLLLFSTCLVFTLKSHCRTVFAFVIPSYRESASKSYFNLCKNKMLLNGIGEDDTLFVLGLGRVGCKVAEYAIQKKIFQNAIGTVRNVTGHKFEDDTIHRVSFNQINLQSIAKNCRYVLITIPPLSNDEDCDKIDKHSNNNSRRVTSALDDFGDHLQGNCWIGVISTTGVYGDHESRWVNEESECNSVTSGSSAARYLEYEQKWKAFSSKHTIVIFRCAGIYSNDQSALHTVYRTGRPVPDADWTPKATASITNRIHVDDIARAVSLSIEKHKKRKASCTEEESRESYRIYNLADNLPENRDVVFSYAADLLENILQTCLPTTKPNSITAITKKKSTRDMRRGIDRKRISNERMRDELLQDSALIFPSYKEGLKSILNDRNNPWW